MAGEGRSIGQLGDTVVSAATAAGAASAGLLSSGASAFLALSPSEGVLEASAVGPGLASLEFSLFAWPFSSPSGTFLVASSPLSAVVPSLDSFFVGVLASLSFTTSGFCLFPVSFSVGGVGSDVSSVVSSAALPPGFGPPFPGSSAGASGSSSVGFLVVVVFFSGGPGAGFVVARVMSRPGMSGTGRMAGLFSEPSLSCAVCVGPSVPLCSAGGGSSVVPFPVGAVELPASSVGSAVVAFAGSGCVEFPVVVVVFQGTVVVVRASGITVVVVLSIAPPLWALASAAAESSSPKLKWWELIFDF